MNLKQYELHGWDEDADLHHPFGKIGSVSKKNKREKSEYVEILWVWICPSCVQNLAAGLVGRKMCIWWWDDKTYYHAEISEFDSISRCHRILYDDKQWEFVYLGAEIVLYSKSIDSSVQNQEITSKSLIMKQENECSEAAEQQIRKYGRIFHKSPYNGRSDVSKNSRSEGKSSRATVRRKKF